MRHKKKGHDEAHADESWLLPYSDMMTLLLALFIVMFASSTVDEAKYNAMMESMYTAFGGTIDSGNPVDIGQVDFSSMSPSEENLTFSDLQDALTKAVIESGYKNSIEVIDGGDFITVRFSEAVLFTPDSAIMTAEGSEALQTIGDILLKLHALIGQIQIEGHTAFIGEEADKTMAAWDLSSDRALIVLEYLINRVGYDQSKMNMAGYSHFVPVASNDTAEGRARNRRVELRILPDAIAAANEAATASQADQAEGSSEAQSGSAAESQPESPSES